MGNEQSQPVSGEARPAQSDSEEEDFDLSAIPDTRRGHSSPTPATASPPPPTAGAEPSESSTMSRKRKKGKTPRANSKKKRKQSREADDEDGSAAEAQPKEEDAAEDDDARRLAQEILLREKRRKIREEEPEMFDEYAMSEDSSLAANDAAEHEEEPVAQVDGMADEPDAADEQAGVNGVEDEAEAESEPEEAQETAQAQDEVAEGEGTDTNVLDQEDVEMEEPQDDLEADGVAQNTAGHETQPNLENLSEEDNDSAHTDKDAENVTSRPMVEETPVSKPRKRKQREHASPEPSSGHNPSKRQKKAQLPLTTDLGDSDEAAADDSEPVSSHRRHNESARRQSNMEDYTQPFARGSDLRHPVYNPESPEARRIKPRFEVIIPMSSAGPSGTSRHRSSPTPVDQPEQTMSSAKSTNGLKRRPKGPLSPIKTRREDEWDVENQPDQELRNGLAKTTARRTLDHSEEMLEEDDQSDDTASGKNKSSSKKKAKSAKGKEPAERSSSPSKATSKKRTPHPFRCPICNSTYASEKSLEKHRKDPTAHANLIDCEHCDEQFATKTGLARHQKEEGHGFNNRQKKSTRPGKRGQFTPDEKNKLDLWREAFCDEHELNHYEFNEIMTASGKSGKANWPYKFIEKRRFQQEYYDVLPGRDVRSMRRYRANYSNVDRSRDFTEQDDEDILILVAQLGQKWVEIGDQLTRDPEALRQRWKNKLQFDVLGTKLNKGNWEDDERKRFDDAVTEIRKSALSQGIDDIDSFNWTAVSLRVKTRTAPQCANHWRAMYGKMYRGQWIDSGISQLLKPKKNKSKMEMRLGQKPRKSQPRITASDDEDQDETENAEAGAEQSDDNAEEELEQEEDEDPTDPIEDEDPEENDSDEGPVKATPHKSRKPNIGQDRTPANHLSASQAFEQTQAHTSEVRKSAKRRKADPSQEQPSPGITLQVRPERSPEFGRRLDEVLDDDGVKASASDAEDDDLAMAGADGEDENEQQSSAEDEQDAHGDLVDDQAQETTSDEATQSADEGVDKQGAVLGTLPNGKFKAINGHRETATTRDDGDSDADSIVQIFKNAQSPSKKKYGGRQQRIRAQRAKEFRWPEEETRDQSDAESEASGLGLENLPR